MSSHLPHIENKDGQVELVQPERLLDSELYNRDLGPVPVRDRRWTAFNFAATWIALAHCIPTYMLASALVGVGMSAIGAAATVLLGNALLVVPLLLNAHAGARYGIPFAVQVRAAYGMRGAHVATLIRALVACGWFGIQTWIGGHAVHVFLCVTAPGWAELAQGEWIAFAAFWVLNVAVALRDLSWLRHVENFAAPFVLVMTCALLLWAFDAVGSWSVLVGSLQRGNSLGDVVPAVTATIGFWATVAVSAADISRYAASQREQIVGQGLALPWAMGFYASLAAFVTQATVLVYGDALWDPVRLVAKFRSPVVIGICALTVVLTTLSVNIAANVVSPARAFANAWPKRLSFRVGALVTALAGVCVAPWRLLEEPGRFLFVWLLGTSGPLGAVAGVMIVDYWIVRRRHLALGALYDPDGEYAGVRKSALAATAIGCFVAVIGAFVPVLKPLYDIAFFSGLGASAIAHWAFANARPRRG
ncbi:MAG: NCS1 family nucleobase:cation symporter-1 [Deltaproteobacteria bacterium]|nr:NCS1 family nucleobase:cation symporter-1 [Deltaproteobacteria bacterium]